MTWMDEAKAIIAHIDAGLPADADLKTRKRALRENAWRLHQGTSWGKKVWSKATKAYLFKHGAKSDAAIPPKHLSPLERMMARAAISHGGTDAGK